MSNSTHKAEKATSKPRIYDDKNLEIVYIEDQPSRIEEKMKEFRLECNKSLHQLRETFQGYINQVISLEKKTETTVLNLVPKDEIFIPNALYVGIVGISGSILTRNRNILLRTLAPLSLGTLSAYYFIPGTTNNIAKLIHSSYQDNKHLFNNPFGAESSFTSSTSSGDSSKLETTISEVQSMYTTRSDPGVRAVLEQKNE
ncbi:hypothetical protein DSO57_1028480 [Entomophthora muscae]|uniref:Uncharacterized protein n=1 Tax=Entomophthora muscae TaxID=34485 RepID=A0ACC2UB74_9FUNG|nr:hypothetical protein DSO57_1028480 [Entomophthora muscae]